MQGENPMALNKITIQIYGTKYPIVTQEDPSYVAGLAHTLDDLVRELMDQSQKQNMSVNQALVLIAMNYLDSYEKSEKSADNLRNQIAEYLEDAAKARMEAAEARRELQKLERRVSGKE